MSSTSPPTVYVIAGPNGAGKTTFATKFLPDFVQCREFLNADLIARGLAPFSPETQNYRAGKLMLQRMDELTASRQNFSLETTLAGQSYVRRFQRMKSLGYYVHLYFLWLPNSDFALQRVANRVRQGGHPIPDADVHRRYNSGIRNFFQVYASIANQWQIYDASDTPPELIAEALEERVTVLDPDLFEQIQSTLGDE